MNNDAWKDVQGWMNPKVCYVLSAWRSSYDAYLRQFEINLSEEKQHSLEIGVHHGRLLLALESITPNNSKVFGLDLFDRQIFNIDRSGKGNLKAFKENVEALARRADRVIDITEDSFSIRNCQTLPHAYSCISIDGGHTKEHAYFDLVYANETIQPGGLVILDDFQNINWLGVLEGTLSFLSTSPRRIAPILIGYNKLFLTTISEAELLQTKILEILETSTFDITLKRKSELCGHLVQALI
jgi:hypothetical protein